MLVLGMEVVIALGTNLGDREANLDNACAEIEKRVGEVLRRSTWINTEPLPLPSGEEIAQGDFLNGAVLVKTELAPGEVMNRLLEIETSLGRDRTAEIHWGPRIIDLDFIAAGDIVFESPNLTLPHPEMHKRDFVLQPMLEVCPHWQHPLLRQSVEEMYGSLLAKPIKVVGSDRSLV